MRSIMLGFAVLFCGLPSALAQEPVLFPFQPRDRVAWIGSSSTNFGVWPKTMQFLLRTRNPDLGLTFSLHSTGGGTFATAVENLDTWLNQSKPTIAILNYGVNDSATGAKGLPEFHRNIEACVRKLRSRGVRFAFLTPQASDERKAGADAVGKRKLYSDDLQAFGAKRGWRVYDVYRPMEALQVAAQKDDDSYSILRDHLHPTDPVYVAWGLFLYQAMSPPPCKCSAVLDRDGTVLEATRCKIRDAVSKDGVLRFRRADEILPLFPPVEMPPIKHLPLAALSPYLLTVQGLESGSYEIRCEGKLVGVADAEKLKTGINLCTLAYESKAEVPWVPLAKKIWDGESLAEIGKTDWEFEIRKK